MRLVVDASVAIKWLLDEVGSPHAHHFLSRFRTGEDELFAPDLIVSEVGNALRSAAALRKRSSALKPLVVSLKASKERSSGALTNRDGARQEIAEARLPPPFLFSELDEIVFLGREKPGQCPYLPCLQEQSNQVVDLEVCGGCRLLKLGIACRGVPNIRYRVVKMPRMKTGATTLQW